MRITVPERDFGHNKKRKVKQINILLVNSYVSKGFR